MVENEQKKSHDSGTAFLSNTSAAICRPGTLSIQYVSCYLGLKAPLLYMFLRSEFVN